MGFAGHCGTRKPASRSREAGSAEASFPFQQGQERVCGSVELGLG